MLTNTVVEVGTEPRRRVSAVIADQNLKGWFCTWQLWLTTFSKLNLFIIQSSTPYSKALQKNYNESFNHVKEYLVISLCYINPLDQMRNWFSSNGYHWQSNPVLTVYPWGLAGWLLNTGWPLAKRDAKKKHHFDLTVLERKTFELKVLTLVREINMENLTWEIIIGFFWCFRFRWPFNTSGKQYKEAIGTQSRVTTTA